jgi:hypothetical protein
MTEQQSEAPAGKTGATPPVAPAPAPEPDRPAAQARPAAPVWPVAALAVAIVVGIALSPFWAPALAPLLPWGNRRAASEYAALDRRLTAVEQRPVATGADIDALKSAQAALAQRIGKIETETGAAARAETAAAAAQAALQQLTEKVDALDARSSRTAALIPQMQQQLAHPGSGAADLAGRVAALEHQMQAQQGVDRTGAALLATLLQIREAVEAGRPFPTEYDAFMALAHSDRELAAAATPLAAAAHDGIASRAVLRQRLDELAGQIAGATTPAAAGDWRGKALAELRSLVTIRRIDGAGQSPAEAAVGAAQQALSRGDLAAAATALATLNGAQAEAARGWLAMARGRLTVEDALAHLQKLLVARLDAAGGPSKATP